MQIAETGRQLRIRTATPEDAAKLAAIYAPYVENTSITFEYIVPAAEEFADRIRHTLTRYPYLVAELDGEPVGYAYASAFKSRAAYDWSVETSIYVSRDLRSSGVGSLLYEKLEEYLVAHFHASGYKQDAWHDMIWMEKTLCPHTIPPKPFIPFPEL